MRNKINEALETKGNALGTWVQMKSPEICEIAASVGFDFIIIDMEHGSFGIEGAVEMIRAIEAKNAAAVLRLPDSSPTGIKKALDAGVIGVLIPGIRTGQEASQVARAAKYEPAGFRGACPYIRATEHSLIDWKQYREWSDNNTMVWAIIENQEAIENIEDIASSGLDAVALGPFDLSMNLGFDGDVNHPSVTEALDKVTQVALSKGVEIVTLVFSNNKDEILESARTCKAKGSRLITALLDRWCLSTTYVNILTELQKL